MRGWRVAAVVAVVAGWGSAAQAQPKLDVPHPFLLWTKAEAAELRKRIETDPLAKKQYERMVAMESGGSKRRATNPTLLNLFNYLVLGDEAAGAKEKAELLKFIGKVPEPMTDEFKAKVQERIAAAGGDPDKIWERGMASFGDRHMRDEQTLNTLRYDVLYDLLTPEERAGVEKSMRAYIQFHLDGHKPWHPDFRYGKMSWLPNMSWPRAIGTHLMAVALKDPQLIEAMFNSAGGWKWYFDGYVSDGRFYNEEFAKYYSNIGTMLMYCEALERLGLGSFGYGYTGKGGATMQRYLKMYFELGYPRTDIPGGMANYRRVTMGDAKGVPFGLPGLGDHSIVMGYLPPQPPPPADPKKKGPPPGPVLEGGDAWWTSNNMNGPLPKMAQPLWYEIGAKRFPNEGFEYFLAQMRAPGEELYLPSLYFGLKPIDPKTVKAPAAPSYLAKERGFAFLRADESPAYWEGPAPAVAQQFGMYYAHYAHDCFSLLGYQALNRPIYTNGWGGEAKHYVHQQILSGPPTGYIARHPWKDTVRGHCGVVVDNLQARPITSGEEGLKNHRMREAFYPQAKFTAGKTLTYDAPRGHIEGEVYPGVDLERALVLTRDYLFDLFWLTSDKPRRYEWMVHGMGLPQYTADWKPTKELNGSMLYREVPATQPAPADHENQQDGNDLGDVHKLVADGTAWVGTILQVCATGDPAKSRLGAAFYDRQVGVNVRMLPEKGTTVFMGRPPSGAIGKNNDKSAAEAETGGATMLVRREAPTTAFVALHEPFEGGAAKARIAAFERIAQADGAVAAKVTGKPGTGINDRVLVCFGKDVSKAVTLAGGGESFTFADHAHVRVGADKVEAVGNLTAMTITVSGTPKLILNGKETPAKVEGGVLSFGS